MPRLTRLSLPNVAGERGKNGSRRRVWAVPIRYWAARPAWLVPGTTGIRHQARALRRSLVSDGFAGATQP
jgi:hypothetical protein